jgi:hypothetical protein
MSNRPERGYSQLILPFGEPEVVMAPVNLVSRARGLIDVLDELALMNSAWGLHESKRSKVAWAEIVQRVGSEAEAEEMYKNSSKRTVQHMQAARAIFRNATEYPRLEPSHPMYTEVESDLDVAFQFFKIEFATGPGATERREAYREQLSDYVAMHGQVRADIVRKLTGGMVFPPNDLLS